jgi:hypothetical protein
MAVSRCQPRPVGIPGPLPDPINAEVRDRLSAYFTTTLNGVTSVDAAPYVASPANDT